MAVVRASPLLATCSLAGVSGCFFTALFVGVTGNPVPVAAGALLTVLLALAVAHSTLLAHWEMTPAEKGRWAGTRHVFSANTVLNLAMSVLCAPVALIMIVLNSAWALLPLFLAGCLIAVLGFVHRNRERQEAREEPAEPRLTGPKIIGLGGPEQVPPGWVPVLVHRPHSGMRDLLVDYRLHVDGDRVGVIAPGQTLVIGLPPGPHRLQARYTRLASAPVAFDAVAGTPVYCVVRPGGTELSAVLDQRSRPGEYFHLVRVPPW
ncbi:hypothetical protein CQJ94_27680 [Glycomyces fuscus]|nr:hypothetical protein CQJ94_27680 [Glycomyces fuscus]